MFSFLCYCDSQNCFVFYFHYFFKILFFFLFLYSFSPFRAILQNWAPAALRPLAPSQSLDCFNTETYYLLACNSLCCCSARNAIPPLWQQSLFMTLFMKQLFGKSLHFRLQTSLVHPENCLPRDFMYTYEFKEHLLACVCALSERFS